MDEYIYFYVLQCIYVYSTLKVRPVIIERTLGLVPGPSTTVHIFLLERCTLTDILTVTIRRDLFKPPHVRKGPGPRPLRLLLETSPVLGPELHYRLCIALQL